MQDTYIRYVTYVVDKMKLLDEIIVLLIYQGLGYMSYCFSQQQSLMQQANNFKRHLLCRSSRPIEMFNLCSFLFWCLWRILWHIGLTLLWLSLIFVSFKHEWDYERHIRKFTCQTIKLTYIIKLANFTKLNFTKHIAKSALNELYLKINSLC